MMGNIVEPREREKMEFDVLIVGGGPAGLSAAIRIKQLAFENNQDISVLLVEKGSEIGSHIVSGAVIDPNGLDRLLPEWRKDENFIQKTEVKNEALYFLTRSWGIKIPHFLLPKSMKNKSNYIISLNDLCRSIAKKAEDLGVEIYSGIAAQEIIYNEDGDVIGVATGDMGLDKNSKPKSSFASGIEIHAKYTLFAEGARGSLSKRVIARFHLQQKNNPQKFGLGIKEIWQVDKKNHKAGFVQHSFGWPLDNKTGGGSFLYHYGENLVSIGLVVHLDYQNPTLSPFDEFQRFKHHHLIKSVLEGGERISYSARAITEGGWQSVPKLTFPGGALIGCAAGFVNMPRIKGIHNAIFSGILAANCVVKALMEGRSQDELSEYEISWRKGEIGKDLYKVRNIKPLWSRLGTLLGASLGFMDLWMHDIFGFSIFGTIRHKKPDSASLKPLSEVKPINYPKPDSVISFDKHSSVYLTNVYHGEDQPCHLKLKDPTIPINENLPIYGEPAQFYCPAGVYEVLYDEVADLKTNEIAKTNPRFLIHAQNCIHCKTCDIKDPAKNITWVAPEGSGGPNYSS